ncbi:hypothetical protein E3N88_16763 [Mikania micrantha]|uniref:Short-chain dehydrogenase TIC 32, chloroplastic n=1 Tax=Mikania micrantha TaxID=192012 RepID=A0A5N6NSZ2_9ASTR|nr:hypothetical protein E3N88_16763 [Mikania micrantha]
MASPPLLQCECWDDGTTVQPVGGQHRATIRDEPHWSLPYDKWSIRNHEKQCNKVRSPGYNALLAYGQSKLANALHAKELSRQLKEDGVNITVNSLHPGVIATNLARHTAWMRVVFGYIVRLFLKNVEQGASTTCYLALHPGAKGISGEYWADNNISTASGFVNDPEFVKKFWDFSVELVDRTLASSSL